MYILTLPDNTTITSTSISKMLDLALLHKVDRTSIIELLLIRDYPGRPNTLKITDLFNIYDFTTLKALPQLFISTSILTPKNIPPNLQIPIYNLLIQLGFIFEDSNSSQPLYPSQITQSMDLSTIKIYYVYRQPIQPFPRSELKFSSLYQFFQIVITMNYTFTSNAELLLTYSIKQDNLETFTDDITKHYTFTFPNHLSLFNHITKVINKAIADHKLICDYYNLSPGYRRSLSPILQTSNKLIYICENDSVQIIKN